MDLKEAMAARHSVRSYTDEPLHSEEIQALQELIEECNREGKLHIQLVTEEPKAFDGPMAHYGKFSGVKNYLVLAGPKGRDLDEKCGYYGEKLVLEAQRMGLNTCWVYMTYTKVPEAYVLEAGEKLVIVISIGHGQTQGNPRRSKTREQVAELVEPIKGWFVRGVDAALLAPTAMNQQKFKFSCSGDEVTVRPGLGICSKIDMGIVKYHFEIGAGKENFRWE